MSQTDWSAKSSSTLAKPVTVLPSTSGPPLASRGVTQDGDAVAQGGGDLAGLVELDEPAVQVQRPLEGEHLSLPTGHHQGVETVDVKVVDALWCSRSAS